MAAMVAYFALAVNGVCKSLIILTPYYKTFSPYCTAVARLGVTATKCKLLIILLAAILAYFDTDVIRAFISLITLTTCYKTCHTIFYSYNKMRFYNNYMYT
jgi:hypothetical protein